MSDGFFIKDKGDKRLDGARIAGRYPLRRGDLGDDSRFSAFKSGRYSEGFTGHVVAGDDKMANDQEMEDYEKVIYPDDCDSKITETYDNEKYNRIGIMARDNIHNICGEWSSEKDAVFNFLEENRADIEAYHEAPLEDIGMVLESEVLENITNVFKFKHKKEIQDALAGYDIDIGNNAEEFKYSRKYDSVAYLPRYTLDATTVKCPDGKLSIRVISWAPGPGASSALLYPYIMFRKDQKNAVDNFIKILSEIKFIIRMFKKEVVVFGGSNITLKGTDSWDDLFLNEEASTLLKEDFKFFMENEQWYKEMDLPYKRGYLLHGPPGNGKTTFCKVIMSQYPIFAYSIDFSNSHVDNSELTDVFETAKKNSPAVIFFEDLDRVFGKDKDERKDLAAVTLDHFLNLMDGMLSTDGVVVVATANHPEHLDDAILRRPGRFDRVIKLDNPDEVVRSKYLSHLFRKTDVSKGAMEAASKELDGYSMAFLKELFILSGMNAMSNKKGSIDDDSLDFAITTIIKQYKNNKSKYLDKSVGFGS